MHRDIKVRKLAAVAELQSHSKIWPDQSVMQTKRVKVYVVLISDGCEKKGIKRYILGLLWSKHVT